MRRYLVLILVLSLLLPCLVVPAAATTQEQATLDAIEGEVEIIRTLYYNMYNWFRTVQDGYTDTQFFLTIKRAVKEGIDSLFGYFTVYDNLRYDADGGEVYISDFQNDLWGVKNLFWSWIGDIFDTINTNIAGIRSTLVQWQRDWNSNSSLIYNMLKEIIMSDSDGQSSADKVQDDMAADSTEASEYLDIMDDVTKPDESELDNISDVSDYVDSGDVGVLADAYAPIFENATFLAMVMLSMTFALVAFTLYGKR